MAGHQLPILSFIIPTYMVRCMCGWKQTYEVWPALLVSGGSFALFQLTFATIHAYLPRLVLYPMTDIGGGIFSLIVTGSFLKFWKPKNEWHFTSVSAVKTQEAPLSVWQKTVAWAPYAVMSVFLLLTGFVRQAEGTGPVRMGPIQTNYMIPIPGLHKESYRDARLLEEGRERLPEKAEFNFAWLTNPGTPVLLAALISMAMLRMTAAQIRRVFQRTFIQMKIPIPTIACMLGLSYITRYAGMDATLGIAFAQTALLYPFFAAILGWLGVFLTGTDAGSNALFGSLQKITATEIFNNHPGMFADLSRQQLQVLITTANSTGGVMGKMIDAQSICVATAATNQIGKEADIFKAVLWHSIILASVVGLITMLQAYVHPFSLLVPAVRGP
jgi:lactate permease